MRLRAFFVAGGAALVGALVAHDARAVGTRTFELDTLDKLSGGDLKGVTVGSDGVVRAGWTLGSVPFPEGAGTTATCAVALADGSVLVGTGPAMGGKVVRIAGDQATVFADTKETAVNALAVDKAGAVYAGTTSNKVYRVSQGKAEVFATLAGVENVWALALDHRTGALYAGTGDEGKVMRVVAGAASTVYFKTDEPFVVSLAVADDGAVYAGTGGKGLLYRVTAAGHASVLYDFHGEDVRAVAVGPDRTVWAIANEGGAAAASEATESTTSRRNTSGRNPAGPSAAPRGKTGKGSLWRFDAQGRPERVMHHDEFHYQSLALDDQGAPFVGTGAEGRVYSVDDAHRVALVADTDERQIGALVVAGRTRFLLGSDPAAFHRVLAVGGPDAVWTSKALDAGLRARFGHVRWASAGSVEVSTRSGDTQTPDATWSPWSAAVANGGAVASPAARLVQVRARLRDAGATIADVSLPFVTENLRAVVTEVAARPKGSREPKEGKDKDGVPASGGELPKHDPVVHVTWKVDNPDNDDLRYRVSFHKDGQTRWLDATTPDDVLTRSELDWDTSSLPEGKYRVRVDASDELANPPSDTTHFALETSQVLVDNTPPVIKSITMQGHRLRVEVVDGLGPIARVEVAVDGRIEWRPLAPTDGIFDTADETVDTDITPLLPPTPGPHIVAVRAYDAAGNFVVREVASP
ncbi:MAG TPA: hypothetical protein VHS09_12965 [Polyangiaceae bacterium]|nr:hypothetical protein [Polyangiaceae bacterium]